MDETDRTVSHLPWGEDAGQGQTAVERGRAEAGTLSHDAAQYHVAKRFEILRTIGSGGFGTVFAARDQRLNRPVAIKFLQDRADSNKEDIIREASAAAAIRHDNLALVLDVEPDSDRPYLVMEWVDGQPLDRGWGDSLHHRVACIASVSKGVAELHEHGLIHGDIKFSNVLVDDRGQIKIVDFGLTKPRGRMTDGRFFGGTPGWGAPEQFIVNAAIGSAADVWGLGTLLYHAITGRQPFRQLASEDLIRAGRTEDPALPESIAPGCPPNLQRVCLTSLERDPSRRYANAHEFHADLGRYVSGEEVIARPTLLERGFVGGLSRHLREYLEWSRLGLLTPQEAARASRLTRDLLRTESEWILESRRVTLERVGLYIGCWAMVLAVGVGLAQAWDDLSRWAIPIGGLVVAGLVLGGTAAIRLRQRALAILLPFSGALSWMAYLWVICRETGLLSPSIEEDPAQLVALLLGSMPGGLGNLQLALISASGAVIALAFRLVVSSAAFTLLCAAGVAVATLGLATEVATIDFDRFDWLAHLTACWLPLAVPGFCAGLWLDRRENKGDGVHGSRARTRDAGVLLVISLLLLFLTATSIAVSSPTWYWLTAGTGDPPFESQQALGLLVNGAFFFALSSVLDRQSGSVAHSLGLVLRWIVPMHILGGLAWLEINEAYDRRGLWIGLLCAASVAFAVASVPKQWKPFLFSGLAGLALAYARLFELVEDHYRGKISQGIEDFAVPGGVRIVLTVGALMLGLLLVIGARRFSSWSVARRLRRWQRKRDSSRQVIAPDARAPTE